MSQSRTMSLAESCTNVAVGLLVALLSQYLVFPIVGIELQPLHVHIEVALWFTVISLIRSYVLRRWFNAEV